mmetsp:Transcript_3090/g.18987  ORF Transcript_3090/g.18987 Transcript_3090/m.18987 type:complete len:773 (-) Transcript_3090:9865-12183(-)
MERSRSEAATTSAFRKYERITRLGQLPMLSVGPGSPLNRSTLGIRKLMQKTSTVEGVVKGKYSLPDGRLDLGKNLPLLANRYAFISSLGEGGSAQVIVARDHWSLKRQEVVIKVMKLQYAKCGEQEIRLLRYLNTCDPHDMAHCVRLISCFSFAGHTCLVLEKLGKSLLDYIGDASNLPRDKFVQQLRKISTQLMTCLTFLSSVGIVHADMKPENILFVKSEGKLSSARLKVIDFGNAFCTHTDADILLGSEVQTPYYRAPEVLLGMRYGTPIDLWSLGCILTEICLQCPLFPCRSPKQLLCQIAIAMGRPPPTHMLQHAGMGEEHIPVQTQSGGPGVGSAFQALNILDADFADLIKRLLQYDPATRLAPEEGLCHPFCTRLFPFQVLLQSTLPNIARESWLKRSLHGDSRSCGDSADRKDEKVERSPSKKVRVQTKEEHAYTAAQGSSKALDANEKCPERFVSVQRPVKLRVHRASLTDGSPSWLQEIHATKGWGHRREKGALGPGGEGSAVAEPDFRRTAFGKFTEEGSTSRPIQGNSQGQVTFETKESMQETSNVPVRMEDAQEGGDGTASPFRLENTLASTQKQYSEEHQEQHPSTMPKRPGDSKADALQQDGEKESGGRSASPGMAEEEEGAAAPRRTQISAWQKAAQILQETAPELREGSLHGKSGSTGPSSTSTSEEEEEAHAADGSDDPLDSTRRRFASSPRRGGGIDSKALDGSVPSPPPPSSSGRKRKVHHLRIDPSSSRPTTQRSARRRTSAKPWWIASPP